MTHSRELAGEQRERAFPQYQIVIILLATSDTYQIILPFRVTLSTPLFALVPVQPVALGEPPGIID